MWRRSAPAPPSRCRSQRRPNRKARPRPHCLHLKRAREARAPSESALPVPPSDDEPFLPGIVPEAEAAVAPMASSDPEPAASLATGKSTDESATSASADGAAAAAAPSISDPAVAEPENAPSAVPVAAEGEPGAETPSATSAETVAATAGVTQEAQGTSTPQAEPSASEPELIEVWRQQRSAHPRQRAHVQGQGAGEKRGRRRHDRDARAGGPTSADAAPTSEKTTHAEGRREEGRPQRDNRAHAGGRPPRRDKRHGSRPEHGAEHQKREDAARPYAGAQRPDKRAQKAIDPDNPFAKLMALKAQMEEEGQR